MYKLTQRHFKMYCTKFTTLQMLRNHYFLAFAAAFRPFAPAFCLAMIAFAPFCAAALALPFRNCFWAPSADLTLDFPFPAGLLLRDRFRVGSDLPAAPGAPTFLPFPFPAGDLGVNCKLWNQGRQTFTSTKRRTYFDLDREGVISPVLGLF